MSATQPIGIDPSRETGEDAVKRQLDALANGECDHVTFLNAMKERFRFEPDENWEVLALLDQYYRRGKIPLDVFRAIKNGFAEYILGPQVAMPTLHKVATPPQPSAASAPAPTVARAVPATPAPTPPPAPATAPSAFSAAAAPVAHVTAPHPAPAPAAAPTLTAAPGYAAPAQPSIATTKPNAAPLRELAVGDVLRDRYRVEGILARGSSGTIFEISDAYRLNLPPVGKRLAAKLPRTPDPRGALLSHVRHEFHQLQHLSHPNIVRAFDFDRDGAISFFTMELLNGVHLTQVLHSKPSHMLPRAHALAVIRDLGSAIVYAHSRGVVHGDVNPQNVFITSAGEVRLLGFGAAHKLAAGAPTPEFERASAASDTQRYASCEVFEGNRPDAQDDVYSLSCVAYLLLRGKHPYGGSTSIEARAGRQRPRRPSGLTYQQWRTLRAGLRTEAKKRPATAQEWLDGMALRGAAARLPVANEMIEGPADRSRGWQYALGAVVLVAIIAVGYWFSISGDAPTLPPPLTGEPAVDELAATPSPPSTAPPVVVAPPPAVTQRPTAPPPAAVKSAPTPAATTRVAQAPAAVTPPAVPAANNGAATNAATTAAAAAAARAAGGPARIEMAVDTLDAEPTDTVVHVTVRRRGSLRGTTSFTWWTESGTAKPGTDFSPILPHVEQMQDGESSAVLTVPLISTLRAQPKGFYVGIESTDGGAQIGARALTQVTLPATN